MKDIIFLHNPRCSKSREALKLLESTGKSYTLREYLKNPLDYDELLDLKNKLGMDVIDFTRAKEKEFSENSLSKKTSENDILRAMSKFPKLMERPILISRNKAIVGRPPEKILEII